MRCPECHEPCYRLRAPIPREGWALTIDEERRWHAHSTGGARDGLCPVMTARGYQPALPESAPAKVGHWG